MVYDMDEYPTQKRLIDGVRMVKDPSLIKISTIKRKHLDTVKEIGTAEVHAFITEVHAFITDSDNYRVIGYAAPWVLFHTTNQILKMRDVHFAQHYADQAYLKARDEEATQVECNDDTRRARSKAWDVILKDMHQIIPE